MANAKISWTKAQIDLAKKEIKSAIANSGGASGDAETQRPKLRFIQKQLQKYESDFAENASLKRLIYIISALVHHERNRGLTGPQISRLVQLGHGILQAEGIKPSSSKLSFLYGEIHLVRSQISRKEGQQWRAAWEQQVGLQLSKAAPVGGDGFQSLAIGNRNLRMGNASAAIKNFDLAMESDINAAQVELVAIGKIRALRFSGKLEESEKISSQTISNPAISDAGKKEIEWESLCRNAVKTNDLNEMMRAIRKRGSHYEATYLWEGYMWAASNPNTSWHKSAIKLKNLMRVKSLRPQNLGQQTECGLVIEKCYDYEYPLNFRYQFLGEVLSRADDLITIDKVMLLWSASARWLARSKSFSLASLALREYQAISFRLTEGQNPDVFNLVSDLTDKPWFV